MRPARQQVAHEGVGDVAFLNGREARQRSVGVGLTNRLVAVGVHGMHASRRKRNVRRGSVHAEVVDAGKGVQAPRCCRSALSLGRPCSSSSAYSHLRWVDTPKSLRSSAAQHIAKMSQNLPLVAPVFAKGKEPLPPGWTEEDRTNMMEAQKYQTYMQMGMESCAAKTVIAGGGGECSLPVKARSCGTSF